MGLFSAGLFDKAYYNSGTYATPVWVLVDGLEDLDFPDEKNDITLKIRRFLHELTLSGQKKKELSFKLLTEPDSTVWGAFHTAYNGNTTIEVLLMYKGDSATTGSKGIRMNCEVTKFGRPQPLEGADMNDVTLKPSAQLQGAEVVIHEPAIWTIP